MMNTISILGSTGSIGRQTLDVAEQLGLRVAALTANSNVERMEAQCRKFRPRLAVMTEEAAAKELAELIGVPSAKRLEAFDISHISGYHSVASMVVFENGKARPNEYRKFKLRTIDGPDDYASMREVLTRRFTDERFKVYPDILMMDGGKGQVNIALEVLDELHLNIPVCGMVKDDYHRTRGLYYNNKEVEFPKNTQAFDMVTRLQDEAHRFAIEYHRSLRSKSQVHSILEDIPGIGPARRKDLMGYFKDISRIREASIEELMQAPSMNRNAAEAVYGFFHKE